MHNAEILSQGPFRGYRSSNDRIVGIKEQLTAEFSSGAYTIRTVAW